MTFTIKNGYFCPYLKGTLWPENQIKMAKANIQPGKGNDSDS
jgi:hypothetical protein